MAQFYRIFCLFTVILLLAGTVSTVRAADAAAVTYYVSNSAGNDANSGLSAAAAFKSIAKVNSLNLQPGAKVLFKCGDIWRGQMLTIVKSGVAGQPITFGSYPAACANKPILSGAQTISGWASYSGNIYVANLSTGANAGKFGLGINQLFGGDKRLTLGRWPNLSAADGGYSTIDGQTSGSQITDNQLPAGNWTGAVAHIRGMRWYILNRNVTARAGQTLTLGASNDCWGGNCTGWGYFLNNHLLTLDSDGEWYYDSATHQVYLYSVSGAPANGAIEGSAILKNDDRSWGGITLGEDLMGEGVAFVTIENLRVQRWFRSGIATPTNFAHYEPHHLVIRNNVIEDSDAMGINLAAWVYDASDGRPDGWRGGYGLTVSGNTIINANSMGINLYSRNSTFSGNTILGVGRIANLGAAGMGCAMDAGGGSCTEDGDGLRIKVDQPADTGNNNTILGNRIEDIAYNGIDIFGHTNTIQNNFIYRACAGKGDCGAVRTFGRDSLASSPVYDLTFDGNIILDTTGTTYGCHSDFDALFGFGLYIDNYSRNVTVTGNTIMRSTVHGILFQNSTGPVTWNTLYDNGRTYPFGGAQVYLGSAPAAISNHANNILYSLNPDAFTLSLSDPALLGASNNNAFFSPYDASQISANGDKTLAQWKAFSGKDGASTEDWFNLAAGAPANSKIFYNASNAVQQVSLGNTTYKDLDQNLVSGTLTLQPYKSKVLVIHSVVDTVAPTVLNSKRSEASPTNLATVHFSVAFSEPVTGVDVGDFTLTSTGSLAGAAVSAVSGSGALYTVAVTTGTGSGGLRLNVADNDSIIDASSNHLGGTGAGNGAFIGGEVYAVRPLTQTIQSTGAYDGWVLESGEASNVGGTFNDASPIYLGDAAVKKQYLGILSFATGAVLPDNAIVTGVTLKVKKQAVVGGGDPLSIFQGFMVDIKNGFLSTGALLQVSDFQAAASKTYGPFSPVLNGGWYGMGLTSPNAYINKLSTNGGVTQIRLRFKLDDNNNAIANYLSLYSGDAAAADRPQLVVMYYVP